MAGSLKDKLPNRALNGHELRAISMWEFRSMLAKDPVFQRNIAYKQVAFTLTGEYHLPAPHSVHSIGSRTREMKFTHELTGELVLELAATEFANMMDRDFIFGTAHAYRHSRFTLTAAFHFGDPFKPKDGVSVVGQLVGEAPIVPTPAESSVVGFQREVNLENPNLDRIAHDLPIVLQRASPPAAKIPDNQIPGEPPLAMLQPPVIENMEYRYDKEQFPSTSVPVDTDISEQAAAKMGIPVRSE